MKFMQNILRALLFTCFLLCGQEIFGATAYYVDLGPNGLNSDTFKQAILSNNRKPFKIRQAYYGSITGTNDNPKLLHAGASPAKEITTIMQQYADKGLFAIPTNFAGFLQTPRRKGTTGIWVKFKIDSTQNDYIVIIKETNKTDYLIDPQNGKKFIAQNEDDLVDSLQEENITQEEDIITVPPSGSITLQVLDTYLKTISIAPTLNIGSGCWYGAKGDSRNLTDIVKKSLQQHTDKGLLAFPANMNQYFGKDPISGALKNLYIDFTMNGVEYNITIPEGNSYIPTSKYLYKIPNGTVNPFLSTPPTPAPSNTPDSLTSYLTQFNTKEELEAEIKRITKFVQVADLTPEASHDFDAKLKALKDKLATLVSSQPDPSSVWPPAGAITYDQLKIILETNNKKPFKINDAKYHSLGVTEKLQTSADMGMLYMPKNMNAAFGDPAPGRAKLLVIFFTINQREYKLTLGETWFMSSPEWFKQPNQYILLAQATTPNTPETLTIEKFKQIIFSNNGKPFTINKANYGRVNENSNNVTTQMQQYANSGIFAIPTSMNFFFGQPDPNPGRIKSLMVTFTIQNKQYSVSIGEYQGDSYASGIDPKFIIRAK